MARSKKGKKKGSKKASKPQEKSKQEEQVKQPSSSTIGTIPSTVDAATAAIDAFAVSNDITPAAVVDQKQDEDEVPNFQSCYRANYHIDHPRACCRSLK